SVECADGVHIGNQCLYFSKESLSWNDAKTACHAKQARLAILKDQPDTVAKYAKANYSAFWLGGSDAANEGNWKWLDGQPFDDQFPWSSGQPNSFGGDQDCLLVHSAGFDDRNCPDKWGYICEL
ncbi:unnamed protein product, partial [Meganyctiphanes norvegica]